MSPRELASGRDQAGVSQATVFLFLPPVTEDQWCPLLLCTVPKPSSEHQRNLWAWPPMHVGEQLCDPQIPIRPGPAVFLSSGSIPSCPRSWSLARAQAGLCPGPSGLSFLH